MLSRPRIGATCLPWVATRKWTLPALAGAHVKASTDGRSVVRSVGSAQLVGVNSTLSLYKSALNQAVVSVETIADCILMNHYVPLPPRDIIEGRSE